MIEISSFLRPRFQRMLPQYQTFLDDIGVPASHYSVAHAPRPGGVLVATYGPDDFEMTSYATVVKATAGSVVADFTTGLDNALFTAASILEDRGLQNDLATLVVEAGDGVLARLHLAPEILKPRVAAWTTGNFIASDAGAHAVFSVDIHGEIAIEARSATFVGAAVYFAAWQRAEASNLSARVATFASLEP